jgi:GNAT superfamily N-acetyltransferase
VYLAESTGVGRLASPAGLSVTRHRSFHDVDDAVKNALVQYGGRRLWVQCKESFCRGDELWVGRVEDQPVGVCWTAHRDSVGPYPTPLDREDAVVRSAITFPAFRRRGFFGAILRHAADALLREGAKRILVVCHIADVAVRRGVVRAGFGELGVVRVPRIPRRSKIGF